MSNKAYDFNTLLSPAFSKSIPNSNADSNFTPSTPIPVDIFKVDVMAFLNSFKENNIPIKPITENQVHTRRTLVDIKQAANTMNTSTTRKREFERRSLKAAPRQVNIKF
ncbi:hypothetical protein TVAG_283770 [Trichomonas vaginalis G3]|uniref:Uncharacterized protein n=1 Tax=Trichomonas vaginalis (strain ATCC PRA-98 / G3) TaxID=412133 RepID=A2DET1_TRIV3|nr:hypothetical protein TVAGG3_0576780 [Trichomonas vaginalis G3]EAY21208.1 hypothetical protein TVAG_283770 [Trichomonas vaginalis G3]KAI5522263.1 hypothetical protein TVAGG3_0576780 [Trichomonas vaginalis G3]|eukprot:XP_001582194.1 hypothetical protein [Trichomonas vaginalis G3]